MPAAPPSARPRAARPAVDATRVYRAAAYSRRVRLVRRVVQAVSWALPGLFFLYFLAAGLMERQALEQSSWLSLVRRVVQPPAGLVERLLGFHPALGDWNLVLVGLGLLALFVRTLLLMLLEKWERRADQRWLKAKAGE